MNNLDKTEHLKKPVENSDVILIGAGAGLSTSAGFIYNGDRFEKYFSDFIKKYKFRNMYEGGFYPFESLEVIIFYFLNWELVLIRPV